MIVLHGLLGSKVNFNSLCKNKAILSKRDSWLLEMRNHAASDHHAEHNYVVMSDDVMRFADSQNLDRFTVMGHSMGARTAMTIAQRYPDRIDGCISIDAAPVNEKGNQAFGSFAYSVLEWINEVKADMTLSRKDLLLKANDFFKGKKELVALVDRCLDPKNPDAGDLKWVTNVETLKKEFDNIPYFDESIKANGKHMYFLMGARSRVYPVSAYKKVFTDLPDRNIVTLDAGHWVHFEKPLETLASIGGFLEQID